MSLLGRDPDADEPPAPRCVQCGQERGPSHTAANHLWTPAPEGPYTLIAHGGPAPTFTAEEFDAAAVHKRKVAGYWRSLDVQHEVVRFEKDAEMLEFAASLVRREEQLVAALRKVTDTVERMTAKATEAP